MASNEGLGTSLQRFGSDRRNRKTAEQGIDLVDGQPHLAVSPPHQQSEQTTADELRDLLRIHCFGAAPWPQYADFISYEINEHLVRQLLDDRAAPPADHGAE